MGIALCGSFIFFPLTTKVLDIINPLNETRSEFQLIQIDFFIDAEKYFYMIHFILTFQIAFVGISGISTDLILLNIVLHIIALTKALR